MQENQPQFNPTAKPPLPSPSANSQSHKRLLVNPNPNPNPNPTTPSPQSSLSSDSSSDHLKKKTRELPNLSDCHCCNRRVNFTNPSDRLRILDSAWRVVLLCKDCVKFVELGEICSYCLSNDVSGFECFKCGRCDRLVHKDCVFKYGMSPPWSYCPVEMRFEVCVDCWVPNSVKSKGKGKGVNGFNVLEDCVREAECVAGEKYEVLAKAKEDASRKAVVAKKAVAFANGVLDAMNKGDGLEDEELALQLHRAMNSSPRIARSFGPVNYSRLGGGKSRKLGFFEKIRVRGDRQLNQILEVRTVSEHLVCDSDCENGKGCRDIGDIGMAEGGVVRECNSGMGNGTKSNPVLRYYQRRNKWRQMLKSVAKSTQGMCNSGVDDNVEPALKCYQRRNKLKRMLESEVKSTQGVRDRVLLYYSRRKHDRYLSKYRRRKLSSKVVSNGERRNLYDSLRRHDIILALPTPLNCPKRLKISSSAP